ncbi:MAG: 50S ribosomal protein L18 [Holosporales bacterium]|jgi:large subunit ribosomal protein L18|nr:50S ribosomal protein L18 [Holosporales bacterium]
MSRFDENFKRRERRVRHNVKKCACGRKRLSIFRSQRHVYAQIIDDERGVTLCSVSTLSEEFSKLEAKPNKTGNVEAASSVGKLIAQRALGKGIRDVVFDRGGYAYHGRIKAFAEAAREGGLVF